jgi:hypothetical protein
MEGAIPFITRKGKRASEIRAGREITTDAIYAGGGSGSRSRPNSSQSCRAEKGLDGGKPSGIGLHQLVEDTY